MPFQTTVNWDNAAGIEGELSYSGPLRAEPGVLIGATPVNNVFGRVFFEVPATPGQWAPGNTGGTRFGVMVSPKEHASFGTTAGGPLAPTLTLPNGTIATIMTMGECWARTASPNANVGDVIHFNNTTGVLSTVTPGTAVPGGSTLLPGAIVSRPPGGNLGLFGLRITA